MYRRLSYVLRKKLFFHHQRMVMMARVAFKGRSKKVACCYNINHLRPEMRPELVWQLLDVVQIRYLQGSLCHYVIHTIEENSARLKKSFTTNSWLILDIKKTRIKFLVKLKNHKDWLVKFLTNLNVHIQLIFHISL